MECKIKIVKLRDAVIPTAIIIIIITLYCPRRTCLYLFMKRCVPGNRFFFSADQYFIKYYKIPLIRFRGLSMANSKWERKPIRGKHYQRFRIIAEWFDVKIEIEQKITIFKSFNKHGCFKIFFRCVEICL